jgi:hypothetical protein
MSDGFVYFIQEEVTDNIKIGFSEKHPKGRLNDFQTGNSNKLILLGYIEGTYEDEYNLHQEFSEERIRKENEWFESSPRLVNRIKELMEESLEDKKSEIEDLNVDRIKINENDDKSKEDVTPSVLGRIWDKEKEHEGNCIDGLGKEIWFFGQTYEGEWKNGMYHGQGTFTDKDGSKKEGIWKEGVLWNGTKYNKNGDILFKFKNGEIQKDIYGNLIKE